MAATKAGGKAVGGAYVMRTPGSKSAVLAKPKLSGGAKVRSASLAKVEAGVSRARDPAGLVEIKAFFGRVTPRQMPLVLDVLMSRKGGREALLRAASSVAGVDLESDGRSAEGLDTAALEEASGGMLTSSEVAARLGQTRQNVSVMLKSQRILGVRFGTRWRFPAVQLREREVLPGLPVVIQAMGALDPWRKLEVLLAPAKPAERRPIELLRAGDRVRALTAASRSAAELADALGLPAGRASGIRALDEDLEAELRRDRAYEADEPIVAAR